MCDSDTEQKFLTELSVGILKLLWIERNFELRFRNLWAELESLQSMHGSNLNLYLCNLLVRYQTTFLWNVSRVISSQGVSLLSCLLDLGYDSNVITRVNHLLRCVKNECRKVRHWFSNSFNSSTDLQLLDPSLDLLCCELMIFQLNSYLIRMQDVCKRSIYEMGKIELIPTKLRDILSGMYLMLYKELHTVISNTILEIKRAEETQMPREDLY